MLQLYTNIYIKLNIYNINVLNNIYYPKIRKTTRKKLLLNKENKNKTKKELKTIS